MSKTFEEEIYELMYSQFDYHITITDEALDDIIEKVLSSGGDVEFVDEGILKDFEKIAMIEYF